MITKPIVRAATVDDLKTFYGRSEIGPSFRAIVGVIDEKIVAVGGFSYRDGCCIVFCDIKDEARPYKHHLHRAALRLLREEERRRQYIFASANPDETTAGKWLARLGFKSKDDYLWRASKPLD